MLTVIHTNLADSDLASRWRGLDRECGSFPQQHYDWVASWWGAQPEKREVHIIELRSADGECLAIAPFFKTRVFGMPILRSAPQDFGDFFAVSVSPRYTYKKAISQILEYLASYISWVCVVFCPVSENDQLFHALSRRCVSKEFSQTVCTQLPYSNSEEYLSLLSRNRRAFIRKKLRRFEADCQVTTQIISQAEGVDEVFDEMDALRSMRTDRPRRSVAYLKMLRKAYLSLLSNDQLRIILLRANGCLVSYRVGIIYKSTFYDWETNFSQQYNRYSPGALSIANLMMSRSSLNISSVNFMSGAYDYKQSFSPAPIISNNFMMLMQGRGLRAFLVRWYLMTGREVLKWVYSSLRRKLRSFAKDA